VKCSLILHACTRLTNDTLNEIHEYVYYTISVRNVTFLALVFTSLAPSDTKLKKTLSQPSKYYFILHKNITLIEDVYYSSVYTYKSEI
jgi:hypothetical protein